ncbi:MAG: hypothetical protein IT422_18900 [Pirellulaceae bacterium]|nr:hypothetical protein [Pirellulaceae bacterium]
MPTAQIKSGTPDHGVPAADALVVNEINTHLRKANEWFAYVAMQLKNEPADKNRQEFLDQMGIIATNSGFQIRAGNLMLQARITSEAKRNQVGSLDTVARDAEYYLLARWKSSIRETGNSIPQLTNQSKKPGPIPAARSFAWWLLAPLVWDGAKGSLQGLTELFQEFGLDKAAVAVDEFRQDTMQGGSGSVKQPNSPPGGCLWALKGLRRGMNEDGYAYVREIPLVMLISDD